MSKEQLATCSRRQQRMFHKRRTRLFKEARELAILCDADVAAVVFSPSGEVSEFASSSMSHIIKRYRTFHPQMPSSSVLLQAIQKWKNKGSLLNKKLKCLQEFQRYVFEETNMSLAISKVENSEALLEDALNNVRKVKSDFFEAEAQNITKLGETLCKESNLVQEKLLQIMSQKECVSSASSETKELCHHQDTSNKPLIG